MRLTLLQIMKLVVIYAFASWCAILLVRSAESRDASREVLLALAAVGILDVLALTTIVLVKDGPLKCWLILFVSLTSVSLALCFMNYLLYGIPCVLAFIAAILTKDGCLGICLCLLILLGVLPNYIPQMCHIAYELVTEVAFWVRHGVPSRPYFLAWMAFSCLPVIIKLGFTFTRLFKAVVTAQPGQSRNALTGGSGHVGAASAHPK